jgi:hypothetical protein
MNPDQIKVVTELAAVCSVIVGGLFAVILRISSQVAAIKAEVSAMRDELRPLRDLPEKVASQASICATRRQWYDRSETSERISE